MPRAVAMDEADEGLPEGLTDGFTARDERTVELLHLLGRAHTMALLYVFARDPGPWRFGELRSLLDVSPTVLSERLDGLTAAGLLDRERFDENPPRVEYTATARAEELKPAFRELYRWVDRHGLPEA